jgi:hypothetical protein
MIGQLLTKWTIRLALGFYVAFLAGWLVVRSPRWPYVARWLWTAGCACFVLHVMAAFQFHHHWSHASAVAQTAKETKELMGVAFGEGLYFSYLFLAVWVLDVAAWWLLGDAYLHRPRWLAGLVHGYLGFIALNGAIVFEAGVTRWVGLVACAALVALLVTRRGTSSNPDRHQLQNVDGASLAQPRESNG